MEKAFLNQFSLLVKQVRKMLRIFLTDDALSSKVPQLTLRIAEGDCIVKFQYVEQFEKLEVYGELAG